MEAAGCGRLVGMRMVKVYGERRTWGALGYCLFGFPLAIAGFVFVVTSISVSVGLSVTLIGLPLLGVAVALSRGFGAANRALGRTFLGIDVQRPVVRRRPGIWGYISERNGWRAIVFSLVRFPLGIVDFVVAVTLFAYSFGALTYPIWYRFPHQKDRGVTHHGLQIGPHWFADTAGRVLAGDDVGLDDRRLGHREQPVVGEAALPHGAVLDVDAAVQRSGQAEQGPPFHLLGDDARVDDGAAVDGADAGHGRSGAATDSSAGGSTQGPAAQNSPSAATTSSPRGFTPGP